MIDVPTVPAGVKTLLRQAQSARDLRRLPNPRHASREARQTAEGAVQK